MIRIKKFTFDNKDLLDIAQGIRKKVFVVEQKVDPKLEIDEHEKECHHYLLYDDHLPIATARWRETYDGIKLERFAVISDYRNKGIGTVILREVMQDTLLLNKAIYLHAQTAAVLFYEVHGFVKTGKCFMEANMKHYRMEYVNQQDVKK
ncbi:MAG: GNAT family N-acetyltransferase [Bacteroidetes bacterium]|nr:GNAT family N-acetyltransferase [Bacteroidota bacterium]